MENEYDKKIDEWFSIIGPEKFQTINQLIDSTVEQIGEIVSNDEFLATAEARLFQFAAHVITAQEFTNGINAEYEYCTIDKTAIVKVNQIFQSFISNPLISTSSVVQKNDTSKQAPSPADMLARISQTMTKPTMIAPTKHEYSALSAPTVPTQVPTPSIDPYREVPNEK